MATISELLEEKRNELNETIKDFVHHFPGKHSSNYSMYSQLKNIGRALPKAWVAAVAELLDMGVKEVLSLDRLNRDRIRSANRVRRMSAGGSFREVRKPVEDTETREKKIADMHTRARLIVGFAGKFKNQSATRLLMKLYRVDHGGMCLEGHEYSYRDWNFHALVDAVLEELNINWGDSIAKQQAARELIDSIGKDEADKLALAISAYDVFGHVYTPEEMPKLWTFGP